MPETPKNFVTQMLDQLEPRAVDVLARSHFRVEAAENIAALSQAISLKRIADALEGGAMADKLEDAIVRAIDNGANNAISTWQRHR